MAADRQVKVSSGVERLLYLAGMDRAFKARLLERRAAAAEGVGVRLTGAERAMLEAAPEAQLQATIEGLDVSPENLERRAFLRDVAASAIAAAAVGAAGCSDDVDSGKDAGTIKADSHGVMVDAGVRDYGRDMYPPMADKGGMRPDYAPPAKDAGPKDGGTFVPNPELSVDGIRPDK